LRHCFADIVQAINDKDDDDDDGNDYDETQKRTKTFIKQKKGNNRELDIT